MVNTHKKRLLTLRICSIDACGKDNDSKHTILRKTLLLIQFFPFYQIGEKNLLKIFINVSFRKINLVLPAFNF